MKTKRNSPGSIRAAKQRAEQAGYEFTPYSHRTAYSESGSYLTHIDFNVVGGRHRTTYSRAKHCLLFHSNGRAHFPGQDWSINKSILGYHFFNEINNRVSYAGGLDDSPGPSKIGLKVLLDYTPAVNRSISNSLNRSKLLIPAMLAESSKTIQLIVGVQKRLSEFFHRLLRGVKKRDLSSVIDTLGEVWLEARYGWRPLFYDIKNLVEILDSSLPSETVKFWSAEGSYSHDVDTIEPISVIDQIIDPDSGIVLGLVHHRVEFSAVFDKVTFLHFINDGSDQYSTLAQLGLDIRGLVQTSWDLIPFSFIVDMFINISSYLRDTGFEAHIKPFNGCLTRTFEAKFETQLLQPNLMLEPWYDPQSTFDRTSESMYFQSFLQWSVNVDYTDLNEVTHAEPGDWDYLNPPGPVVFPPTGKVIGHCSSFHKVLTIEWDGLWANRGALPRGLTGYPGFYRIYQYPFHWGEIPKEEWSFFASKLPKSLTIEVAVLENIMPPWFGSPYGTVERFQTPDYTSPLIIYRVDRSIAISLFERKYKLSDRPNVIKWDGVCTYRYPGIGINLNIDFEFPSLAQVIDISLILKKLGLKSP